MAKRQVNLPIEAIINLLNSLDLQAKEEIFQRVFIDCDTAPLTPSEELSVKTAEEEYQRGETISWTGIN